MKQHRLSPVRARHILDATLKTRVLVVGDVMLDRFIWGTVARISPEAPVPVLDFTEESSMPGGAANVARNLTALRANTELFGAVGRDAAAADLKRLLKAQQVACNGLLTQAGRATSVKTRIVAHKQQVVRIDRETREGLDARSLKRLLAVMRRPSGGRTRSLCVTTAKAWSPSRC